VEAILERASAARLESVRELIKNLFPTVEWAFGGSNYGSDFAESWFRELRVCSDDVFDRYFHFDLPKGDLSQATIDRLLTAGILAAIAASHWIAAMLFGLTATDPSTIFIAAAVLLAAGLLAAYPPARHASRIDPMSSLRCE
jgi:hypothetical protein